MRYSPAELVFGKKMKECQNEIKSCRREALKMDV